MDSDPDVLPSYLSDSDSADDSGSEVDSFDEYDMFGPEDNPDEIVVACPNSPYGSQGSFDDIALPAPDPNSDTQLSADDITCLDWDSDNKAETSLHDIINAYGDSSHDSEPSSMGLVGHLPCRRIPGNSNIIQFDDLIRDMQYLRLDYENASMMVKALYEARSGNIVQTSRSNPNMV